MKESKVDDPRTKKWALVENIIYLSQWSKPWERLIPQRLRRTQEQAEKFHGAHDNYKQVPVILRRYLAFFRMIRLFPGAIFGECRSIDDVETARVGDRSDVLDSRQG